MTFFSFYGIIEQVFEGGYCMYSFRYDSWDEKRFPGYRASMSNLYDRSLSYYQKNQWNKDTEKEDLIRLNLFFGYMEYYLVGLLKLRYAGKSNYANILEQLKTIRLVKLLDEKLRKKLNGLTYKGVVTLNPTPGLYLGLDEDQTLQLTLFHELGHIITAANKEDLEIFKKIVYPKELIENDYGVDGYSSFEKGFDLLDEVAVQNAGEDILYDKLRVKRPEIKMFKNDSIYPDGLFHTNFVTYREFQEVASKFARCLSFLHPSKEDDMNDILKKLSIAMFSRDFYDKLYKEIMETPERHLDLVVMLFCMGKIKEAKYSSFGMGTHSKEGLDSSIYFKMFDDLASKNDCTDYGEDIKVQS